jgi:hypothetical protein
VRDWRDLVVTGGTHTVWEEDSPQFCPVCQAPRQRRPSNAGGQWRPACVAGCYYVYPDDEDEGETE